MQTVTMNERGWEILNAVDKFLREYRRWLLEDYDHLDARISDALDAMLKVAEGDSPRGFQSMLYWLNEMKKSVAAFDASGESEITSNHPALNVVEQLEAVRNRQDPTPQQPIEPMPWYNEHSNMRQAAQAYGLFDQKGEPRTDLAQREIDEPGSVLCKGLVRDDIEDWEKPLPFPAPNVKEEAASVAVTKEPESEIAPESLEELFGIGVGDNQIAQMKNMDVESVRMARTTWNSHREQTRAKAEMEASQLAYREKYEPTATDEFSGFDDEQLKTMCRDKDIAVRGTPKRETLIAKLKEAEKVHA